ncbi:hypothetical protein Raf01_64310 [Rugosimonospora africana]|uniref:Uncharacterized protein n=1 Tax=Rugosimonospora africana TaxID=556532 RepID=A0A8J3QW80_9ACTN|nr:hypothetical protein Raf01_64310 [Rugosimonospora africana]
MGSQDMRYPWPTARLTALPDAPGGPGGAGRVAPDRRVCRGLTGGGASGAAADLRPVSGGGASAAAAAGRRLDPPQAGQVLRDMA